MKVVRPEGIGTPIFVLPDVGRRPLAGPFATATAAKLWILEQLEAGMAEERRALWASLSAAIGGATHDLGLELFLAQQVARGKTFAQLRRYLPKRLERRDPKALQAGEAA